MAEKNLSRAFRKALRRGDEQEQLQTLLADLQSGKEAVYWRVRSNRRLMSEQKDTRVFGSLFWLFGWYICCLFASASIDTVSMTQKWWLAMLTGAAVIAAVLLAVAPGYCCFRRTEQVLLLYNSFGRLKQRLTLHPSYPCFVGYGYSRPVQSGEYRTRLWSFELTWCPHTLAKGEGLHHRILYCTTEISRRRWRSKLYAEMQPQELRIHRLFTDIADELCRQGNVKPLP